MINKLADKIDKFIEENDLSFKKFLNLLFKALISPYVTIYGLLSDNSDPLCDSTFHIKHDWAYWDGHYTCKDPNIDDFKMYDDLRQCTQCKIKQSWATWGGVSGNGKWYPTGKDLPLDKKYVTIEVYTSAYPSSDSDELNSDKKSKIKAMNRQIKLDNLLKKKK